MVEFQALSKTVQEYSTNNYIRSYASQLSTIIYPQELIRLRILTDKLLVWYEEVIDDINSNEYLRSKESHIKSFELLKQVKSLIKNEGGN
jgi:hypothetical protein